MDSLSQHLEGLKLVGNKDQGEVEEEIFKSLNMVLQAVTGDQQLSGNLLQASGIFTTLGQILTSHPRCAVPAAQVLAELAKNEELKQPCIDAGLVSALLPHLESSDQDLLLHAGRAIGRICYGNKELQEELVKAGVISLLVKILSDFPESEPLVRVDLLALCNLADLDTAKEALSKTKAAEELVRQLRRAENQERLEIVTEILQLLAENDSLKVQLVEADVQSALVEILQRVQDSSEVEAAAILKTISDLVISLLLGDESMQKLFANGTGLVYQRISSWLMSQNAQMQLTGALAVANFARNDSNCVKMVQLGVVHQLLDVLEKHVDNGDVTVQHAALSALRNLAIPVINKVQMLEEGVAERIQMLLRSEMPPVQFKLLGTLRMLMDGQVEAAETLGQDPALLNRLVQWCEAKEHAGVQGEANRLLASLLRHSKSQEVVRAIQEAQGVKHLVSMTTSEHAIMQNEALIALAIASAINLEIIKDAFKESKLIQNLQKLLEDEMTSPEVKYKSLGLLCSLLGSGDLRKQVEEAKVQDTLENLCNHGNGNVVKQAITALQILKSDPQDSGLFFP
ncbi:rap1 GTPase-GDP dissociation stimulator 1-like isoform X1 [Dromiciops gliroides]|uniref:rap1 GTPase-GDP dissociation stimulator 1-like isoform X1 n=1 Tax=Dromiciops gliroides TaxID=33562 RepID=UPI001CC82B04|nr:rap1 GTPase-GDP dissociation stimulator 1-like isoform X1 [Dromiciops gliroides]